MASGSKAYRPASIHLSMAINFGQTRHADRSPSRKTPLRGRSPKRSRSRSILPDFRERRISPGRIPLRGKGACSKGKKVSCWHCGKEHYMRNCPHLTPKEVHAILLELGVDDESATVHTPHLAASLTGVISEDDPSPEYICYAADTLHGLRGKALSTGASTPL